MSTREGATAEIGLQVKQAGISHDDQVVLNARQAQQGGGESVTVGYCNQEEVAAEVFVDLRKVLENKCNHRGIAFDSGDRLEPVGIGTYVCSST